MTGYRRFGSRLQGHPTPVLPWVDVATGSLGQGLPDGVGVALAGKYLDRLPYRVWVLCGDSEMAEGSIWEALDKAAYYELSNLIAIVDVNRLGQRGPTELEWDLDAYARRAEAFGARVLTVDGHDVDEIDEALTEAADGAARRPDRDPRPHHQGPWILRGRGPGGLARQAASRRTWPSVPSPNSAASATCWCAGRCPTSTRHGHCGRRDRARRRLCRRYSVGDRVATRKAYGDALAALGGQYPTLVALDGEVEQLDLRRRVREGLPRPLLRDVHRRAAAGRGGRRAQRAALHPVRLHVRRVLHPRLRLHPDGGDLRRPTSGWSARTPVSRSVPTDRRRWRSRTWR